METYRVKKADLIGELEGLPVWVVQLMVNEQVNQGNKADVSVFQKKIGVGIPGGGFNWDTTGNYRAWANAIDNKKFRKLFKAYALQIVVEPINLEKFTPKDGDVVALSVSGYSKRIILFYRSDRDTTTGINVIGGLRVNALGIYPTDTPEEATEAEKQLLFDALKKVGKKWNAEKLCVEDVPTPRISDYSGAIPPLNNLIYRQLKRTLKRWDAANGRVEDDRWIPKDKEPIYLPSIDRRGFFEARNWVGDSLDNLWLRRNIVFKTEAEAIAKAKQMLGIKE